MTKACRRCEKVLSVEMFYRRKDSIDGRQYVCKHCTKNTLLEWQNNNPEKFISSLAKRKEKEKLLGFPRSAKWRENNRDKVNASARNSYWNNREKWIARGKTWRAANKEKVQAIKLAYRKNNRESVLAWLMRRRARKLNAPGTCTADQLQARISYYDSKCYLCGAPYEHVDHVIPLARGGSNWPANLRPACAPCNMKKHDKLLSEVK